jgi:hypothetical protein
MAVAEAQLANRYYCPVPVFGINSFIGQFSLISGLQCRLAQSVYNWANLFMFVCLYHDITVDCILFHLRTSETQ